MACANCGAELGADSKFCRKCGAAIEVVSQVGSDQPKSIDQQHKTKIKSGEYGIYLRIAFVMAWAALLAFTHNGFSADSVGEWFGTLVIPFILAYLIARGWRSGNRVRFSYWFLGIGLLLPTLTHHNSLSNLSRRDLMKELIGTKTLEPGLPQSEIEMASVSREFFNEIKGWRKAHDEKAAVIAPKLAVLYTSESFATKAKMQACIEAVMEQQSLDADTSRMFEEWPKAMRYRLDKTDLSNSAKEKYFNGFMRSFATSEFLADRREAMAVESKWADSTIDLYGFAIKNVSQIVVSKNGIAINNDIVREQFNSKLTRSETLHDELLSASKKADDVRIAKLKQNGASPEDLGLDK